MKYTNILKTNLMRATLMLALIVTCATAWAQTTVNYIDADGTEKTVTATVLTGSESEIGSLNQTTWYVVNSDILRNGRINCVSNVNIILADGKTMTVNSGNNSAFTIEDALTIYGQSGQSGTLNASTSTSNTTSAGAIYSNDGSFIVNGGTINVTCSTTGGRGIYTKYLTINDGTVTVDATYGIYVNWGNIAINGGNVTVNGNGGIQASFSNITLSWRNYATDRIYAKKYQVNSNYTISIAEGKYFKDANGNIYCGNVGNSINDKTLQPATQTEFIRYSLGTGNDGSAAHPYTINDANGWNAFCLALEDKDTWNGFSGKIVKLGANITVTRIAGSGSGGNLTANDHPFCGTFDGYGKTLTFNYGSNGSPADENNLAPFRYVNNATIQHLHVAGTIYTKHVHAGGIIGMAYGTTDITDCRSSVNIVSSINGDGTHGGIMSCSWTGSTTNITGCLFDGSIQSASGYTTNQCGGFVGWRNATINVINSLLTADLSTIATPTGLTYPSATFVRNGVANDITNCYYVTAFGTAQGKQRRSITAEQSVTVAHSGNNTVFNVSGITAYKNGDTQLSGLKYGDVLYAGNGDEVSLTLGNTPPEGNVFNGYTVSPTEATLTGNGNTYTLTMPDADVTIGADFYYCPTPTLALVDNSITTHGATVSWTGASDSYILEYAEGNSPLSWTTVSSNATSPYTFNNLNPATTYSVRVTGDCGSDGNSQPSDVVSFTTDCVDFIVVDAAHPFTEGFEGEDFPPRCWEKISLDYYEWSSSSDQHSGSASAYSGYYGPTYLVMPDIQLPSNGTAQLTFWSYYEFLGCYDYGNGKSSVVLLDGDETELWALVITEEKDYIWYETTIDLTAYMGQTISLAFKYEGDDAHGWYVDDVEVTATASIFTKDIVGYEDDESGWYLIASPVVEPITPSATNGFITDEFGNNIPDEQEGTYDLYYFDQTGGGTNGDGMEWRNYRANNFNIVNGTGYLYASKYGTTLIFTGVPYSGDGDVTLTKTEGEGIDFPGWNLVGNPFAETAYILDCRSFYTMNGEGSEIIAATDNSIAPMEGVFVIATEDGEIMNFTTTEPQNGDGKGLVLNLSKSASTGSATRGGIIDRAIVRFDEDRMLPKFQIRENSTKIYIPMDGTDYAVVNVGRDGVHTVSTMTGVNELPVNFKADRNGTYTLSFNTENVEFSYLHLIDNLTGNDVDLLSAGDCGAAPAMTAEGTSYTFEAKTTDYASRFRLVFATKGANDDNETFAFYTNGNWIIANPSTGSGSATLQVIDITGRILSSETVNGSVSKSINQPAGVYMIRLINGETVRTQKVVVK